MHTIALFGGTFDPVHNGHIQTSLSIQSHFNFDSYFFLPCNIPILKCPPLANNQQRIDMLQIAIQPYPQFKLDLREMQRGSPSYMVDTLSSFREENKSASITLILGYDAFLSLPQWHQWEQIISLANLLIINRKQFGGLPLESIKKLLKKYKTEAKEALFNQQAGVIYLFDAGDYKISSTDIRQALRSNNNLAEHMLPIRVHQYIKQWGLYQ